MREINNLAIIPARGGSKRIPKKNIKPFLGKPIISYSIETLIDSKLFDEIIVSTEDSEIVKVVEKYDEVKPLLRSSKNADDFATISDVMLEVLQYFDDKNVKINNLCCLFATAPFINTGHLQKAYKQLSESDCETVFSMQEFSYPIFRGLIKNEEGYMEMIWAENRKKRSQDLPKTYHDAGQFYFSKVNSYKKNKAFISGKSQGVCLRADEAHDIDTLEDWRIGELKYKLLKSD